MKATTTTRPSFGELLRGLRIHAQLTQEELAVRAGVSLAAVSALERGTRRAPQRHTVALIVAALALDDERRSALEDAADRSRVRQSAAHREPPADLDLATLPSYANSFVGRERDVVELEDIVRERRLVSIVGTGGVGKTRLACDVATRVGADFDRIVFADLAPLLEAETVVGELATLLAAKPQRDADIATLAAAIERHRTLVILDNCERIVAAVASIATALLAACPRLTILATSRERLVAPGERVYRLRPLPVPTEASVDVTDLRSSPVLQLFVDRARAVEPAFGLHASEVADALEICRRLDGIPLAVELAVAHLPAQGIRRLRRRLDRHMALPATARDLPERHVTMAATIAWSIDRLDDAARALVERLAIFAGGFTVASAALVCTDDAIAAEEVAAALRRLSEKSLVIAAIDDHDVRYRLLEPVRLTCLERLRARGAYDVFRHRHAVWIADAADAANEELDRKLAARSIASAMERDIDNVRNALERLWDAHAPADTVLAARIVGGLRTIWLRQNAFEEGHRWALRILSRLDAERDLGLTARVMRLLVQSAPVATAAEAVRRAVPVFEKVGDRVALLSLLIHGMMSATKTGAFALAETYAADAAALAARSDVQPDYRAWYLGQRAYLRAQQGRIDEARADLAASDAELRRSDAPLGQSWYALLRSEVEACAGDYRAALDLVDRAFASEPDDALKRDSARIMTAAYRLLSGDDAGAYRAILEIVSGADSERLLAPVAQIAAAIAAGRDDADAAVRLDAFAAAAFAKEKGSHRTTIEARIDAVIAARIRPPRVEADTIAIPSVAPSRLRQLILSL